MTRHDQSGLLFATTLGVAALAAAPALAQAPAQRSGEEVQQEVVITALRDAAITAKVEQTLQDDPYLYVGHITVTTRNGIVTLGGICQDIYDMRQALRLARKIAGKGRVVNEIELMTTIELHD